MTKGVGVGVQMFGEATGELMKPGLTRADLERIEKVGVGDGPDPFGDFFQGRGTGGGGVQADPPQQQPNPHRRAPLPDQDSVAGSALGPGGSPRVAFGGPPPAHQQQAMPPTAAGPPPAMAQPPQFAAAPHVGQPGAGAQPPPGGCCMGPGDQACGMMPPMGGMLPTIGGMMQGEQSGGMMQPMGGMMQGGMQGGNQIVFPPQGCGQHVPPPQMGMPAQMGHMGSEPQGGCGLIMGLP